MQALADTPVVCPLGPRQSGKSTLAHRADSDRPYYTFDDGAVRGAARTDPAGFLASLPGSLTLDETQRAPTLLPAIKLAVDRDRRPGRFLLTGSANLLTLPIDARLIWLNVELAKTPAQCIEYITMSTSWSTSSCGTATSGSQR